MKYDYEPIINDNLNYDYASAKERYEEITQNYFLNSEDPEEETLHEIEFDKLSLVFDKDYNLLVESESYFFGCSFDVYLKTYNDRLTSFLSDFPDACELDFCDYELVRKTHYYITSMLLDQRLWFSIKKRIEFLNNRKAELTTKPQKTERVIELKSINLIETSTKEIYLGQPTNDNANDFFDFLSEFYRPEDKTQIKYVNILHYLKNDADKKHFIFKIKQKDYKLLIEKVGIKISKFDKSANYNEVEKPIFYALENTFLRKMKL
jgi:hypothetical protein